MVDSICVTGEDKAIVKSHSPYMNACDILLESIDGKKRLLSMRKIKHKVFAYITSQHQLLVFRHPYAPEAGIQVPAGTIEEAAYEPHNVCIDI